MIKIVREHHGLSAQVVTSLAIYSCTSGRDSQLEPLLKDAITSGGLLRMKSVRRDVHEQLSTCLVHGATFCLSSVAVG